MFRREAIKHFQAPEQREGCSSRPVDVALLNAFRRDIVRRDVAAGSDLGEFVALAARTIDVGVRFVVVDELFLLRIPL